MSPDASAGRRGMALKGRRRFFGLGDHGHLGWAADEEFSPDCIDRPAKYAVAIDDSAYVGEYEAAVLKKYKGQEDWEEVGSYRGSWPEQEPGDPDAEEGEGEMTEAQFEEMANDEAAFQLDDAWQFDETCDEATIERKKYGQVPFDGLAGRRGGRGLDTYKGLVIRACVPARGRVVELRQTARGQVCVVEKTRRGEQPIACVAGVAAATSLFKAACRG